MNLRSIPRVRAALWLRCNSFGEGEGSGPRGQVFVRGVGDPTAAVGEAAMLFVTCSCIRHRARHFLRRSRRTSRVVPEMNLSLNSKLPEMVVKMLIHQC